MLRLTWTFAGCLCDKYHISWAGSNVVQGNNDNLDFWKSGDEASMGRGTCASTGGLHAQRMWISQRLTVQFWAVQSAHSDTVIFLSFRTDRSRQTVQTQIRLLLIRVYTVCNSLCIFWMHVFNETPSCSTFRVGWLHQTFWVSEYLGSYGKVNFVHDDISSKW